MKKEAPPGKGGAGYSETTEQLSTTPSIPRPSSPSQLDRATILEIVRQLDELAHAIEDAADDAHETTSPARRKALADRLEQLQDRVFRIGDRLWVFASGSNERLTRVAQEISK